VTARINVVIIVYEIFGWGFKSPRVPSGQSPHTYSTLYKLLFSNSNLNLEESLENTKITFYKLFLMIFGILEETWEDINGSYFDFPRILSLASEQIENKFKTITDQHALNRYLFETISVDLSLLGSDKIFRIYMPNHQYHEISYDSSDTLQDVLTKLGYLNIEKEKENIRENEYVPYDCRGCVINKIDMHLEDIALKSIYLYPKDLEINSENFMHLLKEMPMTPNVTITKSKRERFHKLETAHLYKTTSRLNIKRNEGGRKENCPLISIKSSPNLRVKELGEFPVSQSSADFHLMRIMKRNVRRSKEKRKKDEKVTIIEEEKKENL